MSRSITIKDQTAHTVSEQTSSGQHRAIDEIVEAGMHLSTERDRKLSALREASRLGVEDLKCGRFVEIADDRELDAWLDRIDEEVSDRLRSDERPS
jgi:hypothetical protein